MKKQRSFRDFSYNHSDVILAAVILIIAILLILWRVQIIMDYPSTISAETGQTTTQAADDTSEEATATTSDEETTTSGTNKATWDGDALAEKFEFELSGSKTEDLVQGLVDAGLFTSTVDVENACKDNDLETSSIKAGTYSFSKGDTKETIIKAVTNE